MTSTNKTAWQWQEARTAAGVAFFEGNLPDSPDYSAQILCLEPSDQSNVVQYSVVVFRDGHECLKAKTTTMAKAVALADDLLADIQQGGNGLAV